MELNVDLKVNIQNEAKEKTKRAKQAAANKKAAKEVTEDDWKEVFGRKNSTADLRRLHEVHDAWRIGEIQPAGKFSKAEAIRMWKRLSESRRDAKLISMVENTPSNYILIQKQAELDRMIKYLEHEPIIAVDTETTGLDIFGEDKIVGLSLTLPNVDYHYYIPLAHNEGEQLPKDKVLARLKPYLEDANIKKVFHNAKFDFHVFKNNAGIRVRGLAGDTMVMMFQLCEDLMSYRLKDLAPKYLKTPSDTYDELFGKNCPFNTIPLDLALVYAAKDTDLTWRLYQWQLSHFKKDRLKKVYEMYVNIENPITDVTFNMEQTGFIIDKKFAKEYGGILHKELAEAEALLAEHYPEGTNFNSPKQLQKIFYEDWKLPDVSGKQSTDAETLEKLDLETEHEGIKALLKYREITKLIGTYIDKLPNEIKKDGRVHGSFKQTGTKTGRYSSNNPNLQNIPKLARKLFIAPPGCIITGADFSQIEPRVLAHMSGDEHLRDPYINGRDLYSTLASKVFGLPIEQCADGSKYRKMMKTGLLAVMYGTSMWTLSKQLKITIEEAEKFIDDFFMEYPVVKAWIDSIHKAVKKNEFVETMFGRKRRFPAHRKDAIVYDQAAAEICRILGTDKVPSKIWDEKYKKVLPYKLKRKFQDVKGKVERVRRQAVNAVIQGSAADIMKMALIAVDKLATDKDWKPLATVHDEVLLYVPKDISIEEVEEIENAMTGVVSLAVPLKVDAMLTHRWGEDEKSKAEWFKAA